MIRTRTRTTLLRGTSLIEVLVATVVLTLAFLFVSGDMIASTQAEKEAMNRGIAISVANYYLDYMRQDPNFWNEVSGGVWSSPPPGTDPCGNTWPPYDDNIAAPTWHPVAVCVGGPFANLAGHGSYFFMWNAQQQSDPNAANLSVWVESNTVGNNGSAEVFELNQLQRNDPTPNSAGQTPPPVSPSPSPSPTTPPPSVTPKPSTSPTPKPSSTPKPSPTPTPSRTPTPVPSPTVIN